MKHITDMLNELVEREGGYSNRKADRGGPTNLGITLATLSEWRGRQCTIEDIKNLTKEEAFRIYKYKYYVQPKIDRLPAPIQEQVFDIGVNSGPATAVRLLQDVLNRLGIPCTVDGRIGPRTIRAAYNALEKFGTKDVSNALVNRRIAFYQAIVDNDKTGLQIQNINGWMNRAESFRHM